MFELFDSVNESANQKQIQKRKNEIKRRKKEKQRLQDIADYRLIGLSLGFALFLYIAMAATNYIFKFTW